MATINLGAIKFNWKGAYNSSTTYAVDDVVSSGGNSYVCIQAHSNQAVGNATAYWNIMSSAGTNGSNGSAGAEGGTTTLTTRGDLLYRGTSAVARLPKGTSGYYLKQGANDPEWAEVAQPNLSAYAGHILPSADDTYNLGSASYQWANIYTGDLHLSNESKTEGNSIDGTKGDWTIQEGASDLYILNNKNGKKYKFKLEEI